VLTDGGVYDNLGLETVWKTYKTVIVSDGGGHMAPEPRPRSDWARLGFRVSELIDNQVRSLRKIQIVDSLERGLRSGVYWRMRSDIKNYPTLDVLDCPQDRTLKLAQTPTRLARVEAGLQERIINWGYALCDAGMRGWVVKNADPPSDFPYPGSGV
jgi:NTE family protein